MYVENDNIDESCLSNDHLHLNRTGLDRLAVNFKLVIEKFYKERENENILNSFSTTLNVLKDSDVTDNCDVINRNNVAFVTDKTNVHGFRPNVVSLNRIKSKKGIKILNLNVASLYSKIDEIRDIVVLSNAHVLSINESLLDSTISDEEVELPGLCIFRNDRNRHGGGVALYVHQSLSPVRIDIIDNDLESVWVYVASHGKKYIFGSIYRPPSSLIIGKNWLYNLEIFCLSLTMLLF